MTIGEIKQNRISPFEIDDEKLKQLFSFFLHSAPTINSANALRIDSYRLKRKWEDFKNETNICDEKFEFISPQSSISNYLEEYGLNDEATVNKNCKGFVCKKETAEDDYACVLRHIRNSIAHCNVFVNVNPKRKYILFEDFNPKTKVKSATLLFSQTDLNRLKRAIVR